MKSSHAIPAWILLVAACAPVKTEPPAVPQEAYVQVVPSAPGAVIAPPPEPVAEASAAWPALAPAERPPPMGWSSWSTMRGKVTEAAVKAQADALAARLAPYGFSYVNVDDGWFKGCDEHGRPQTDPTKFPAGMPAMAAYVHSKGLRFGIYLVPGLHKECLPAGGTVAGTAISLSAIVDPTKIGNVKGNTYLIDFSRPGAVEYVQGFTALLASWGVDYIKMDFVGPGGGGKRHTDNREEIKQWSGAIAKTGRPIWLELSNNLSFQEANFWKLYANGWRIEGDVEFYKGPGVLTSWAKTSMRFSDAPRWAPHAGPGHWNDLDSLEIGNGDADGLSLDERKSIMALWSISCSPLLLGANLTALDETDFGLLSNTEVLAVDQAGRVATPLSQGQPQQVWRAQNADGSFTVALFNLGEDQAKVGVLWRELGFANASAVRDLWARRDLGAFEGGYEVVLPRHGSQLLRVRP